MTYTKSFLLASTLLFTACTPTEVPISEGGYYHKGIYFGANVTDVSKKGIKAGCMTSKGKYTKSHWLFNKNKEYANGWFLGRNKCRKLLKINENGDLIL